MAVTKIRKLSSWALIALTCVTIVILGLFYFGGDNPPLGGKSWNPKNTDLLLYWMYITFGLTVAGTLIFAIMHFFNQIRHDVKNALIGIGVLVAFVALFFITYTVGNGEPMPELNNSTTIAYNTPTWLKITDMAIYSIYVMFCITLICIVAGSIKSTFSK